MPKNFFKKPGAHPVPTPKVFHRVPVQLKITLSPGPGTAHERRYKELLLLTDWCSVFLD